MSGWVVSPQDDWQTIRADQAHQWAEVAFDGLGWVTFDPPAPGGAPARTPGFGLGGNETPESVVNAKAKSQLDASVADDPTLFGVIQDRLSRTRREGLTTAGSIEELLSKNQMGSSATVGEILNAMGAEITPLENGGALIDWGDSVSMVGGATTRQAPQTYPEPVFVVAGGIDAEYLRTSTGDVYSDGGWSQLDPVEIPYAHRGQLATLVDRDRINWHSALQGTNHSEEVSMLAWSRPEYSMLLGLEEIKVSPDSEAGSIPSGGLPISLGLDRIVTDGIYSPFSATFASEKELTGYSWLTQRMEFPSDELVAARPSADLTYTQLPDSLPKRIRELALEITAGHDSPYLKAKAIETYLQTNYPYAFAPPGAAGPPPGWDPVDWFLFEQRRGTCGQFSSAFVVMARAVGLPA